MNKLILAATLLALGGGIANAAPRQAAPVTAKPGAKQEQMTTAAMQGPTGASTPIAQPVTVPSVQLAAGGVGSNDNYDYGD